MRDDDNSLVEQDQRPTAHQSNLHDNRKGGRVMKTMFMGPIPPPAILEDYERILPGSADRVIRMAERQSEHRQSLENKDADAQVGLNNSMVGAFKRGQWFAFILGMTVVLSGFALIFFKDYTVTGSLFAGTGLASLVGAFLYSSKIKS